MSFESVFQPERIDHQATHLKEGFVMGCVAGTIVDLHDPEGLGRVRVRWDLVSEDPLPNGEDGFAWYTERFTLNGRPGGSMTPLEKGLQVIMIPFHGRPNMMVIIGCLNSRIDRPYPDFDRESGLHGMATKSGFVDLHNDNEGSQFTAYPSGTLRSVDKQGTIVQQTAGNARTILGHDGSNIIENDNSFTQISPDGSVVSASVGGGAMIMDKSGEIQIQCADLSTLFLNGTKAEIAGPIRRTSKLLNRAKTFLSSDLVQAIRALEGLQLLVEEFRAGRYLAGNFIRECNILLRQLRDGLAINLNEGFAVLEELKTLNPVEMGEALDGQIKNALHVDIDEIAEVVDAVVGKKGDEIVSAIASSFPKRLESILDPEELARVKRRIVGLAPSLDALAHDPVHQKHLLMGELVPQGWHSMESLVGLGIESTLKKVEATINPHPELLEKATIVEEKEWWQEFPARLSSAIEQIGELASFARGGEGIFQIAQGFEDLTEQMVSLVFAANLVKSRPQSEEIKGIEDLLVPGESALPTLLGDIVVNLLKDATDKLAAVKPGEKLSQHIPYLQDVAELLESDRIFDEPGLLVEPLTALQQVMQIDLKQEDLIAYATSKVLPDAIDVLAKELVPTLKQGVGDFHKLINAIPSEPRGAVISAREEFVQMATNRGEKGAIAKVGKGGVQVLGPELAPNTRTAIFAEKKDAGMKCGDKGGTVRVEQRMAELLGAERDGEKDMETILEKEGFFPIKDLDFRIAKGGEKNGKKAEPEKKKLRSGVFADNTGAAGMRSGGKGAISYVHNAAAEIKGPEIERDGKKVRTSIFAFGHEAGMESGGKGSLSYVGPDIGELLGPEMEILGEKIRTNVFTDAAQAVLSAGGSKGAFTKVTQQLAEMIGPEQKGIVRLVKDVAQMIGPDGKSMLKLVPKIAQLLGPGGTQLKLAEAGSFLFGMSGKGGVQVLGGVTKILGPSGKVSLAVGAKKILFKALKGKLKIGGGGGTAFTNEGATALKNVFVGSDRNLARGVGMVLDPGDRGAALSSFFPGEWNLTPPDDDDDDLRWDTDEDGELEWNHESARVRVRGQVARIQSLSDDGDILHQVVVRPEGVFVDEINVDAILERLVYLEGLWGYWVGRFNTWQAWFDSQQPSSQQE